MINFNDNKTIISPEIYKLISKISNKDKRNLLRGYLSKQNISISEINEIRRRNNANDCEVLGAILNTSNGILKVVRKKSSSDIFKITNVFPLELKKEIRYTIGYINSEKLNSLNILSYFKELSCLSFMDTETALEKLRNLSELYGASNYLSYKLAYIRSSRELSSHHQEIITEIESNIGHHDSQGLHFSALENLNPKISLFQVAQRRGSELFIKTDGKIRKSITLSNFIPTPLTENDAAGLLLRATQSSLLDAIYSIIILINLEYYSTSYNKDIIQNLDYEILAEIQKTIEVSSKQSRDDILTKHYVEQIEDSIDSLDIYRVSAAFLECPTFTKFRNDFDKVIGVRLLSEYFNNKPSELSLPFYMKNEILYQDNVDIDIPPLKRMDVIYRTYLFLRFINDRNNILELSNSDVRFIFENTIELEMLLSEDEMRVLYDTAPYDTKSLVTVLALALFRKKSTDPDIDFDFRTDFIRHVNKSHNGSILEFINSLLNDSPQIASYIVSSLDEVTLEKMYTLVKNASQAAKIRCDILRAVGHKLNKIEYIIEADSITTRAKVSKLQKYFDSSRMYVDSIAMKKWLDSNPTVSTEQCRSLLSNMRIEAGSHSGIVIVVIDKQVDTLIQQIAQDAFEQFCLNTEFGIQSYLGRRIRHNTLDGVTIDTVDAVFRKVEYRNIVSNPHMRKVIDTWMASYKSIIDKLRRDHLQFRSSGSLFNSTLDINDATTKENIRKLSITLKSSGGSELLNDIIISFCWMQITPQLENASRFIKTTLLNEANATIEKTFLNENNLEGQVKADLHEAVNEVFRKVADWFQVPQTGFISASVRDLCQIIFIDLNRNNSVDFSGSGIDTKYTGISVHRLYDCLAVLLQNAHKHGEERTIIAINANAKKIETDSVFEEVSISVSSIVSESLYPESKKRIFDAIASLETGIDMVTEGYSGIKKIKFITRTSEGRHTISCTSDDKLRKLIVCFIMRMEMATENQHLE